MPSHLMFFIDGTAPLEGDVKPHYGSINNVINMLPIFHIC